MKTRLLIVAAVALCVLIAVKPRRANAQGPLSFFTIAFIPDIHYDFLDGSVNVVNHNKWDHGIRPWLLAHINDSTWNLRGVIGLGDMVSENNGVTPADWTLMAAAFQQLWDAGLPALVAPGNHDTFYPAETAWDSIWGPKIRSWLTLFPSIMRLAADDHFPYATGGGAYTPAATTQYARIDVPTTAGTVKLALTTGAMFTSAAALGQLKAQADLDTDRNVLFGTHMFLGATFATAVTNGDQPCVKNTTLCATYPNANGLLPGDEMWKILKTFPRLVGIVNGHLHEESVNDGYHSAQLTGDAGNHVQAVSLGQQWGVLLLAKFRTDNHTIEWYARDTCANPQPFPTYTTCSTGSEGPHASPAWGGVSMLTELWTPITSAPGISGVSGGVTGRVK